MSEQIIRRSGMAVDMQSTLPWLVAAGAYMLLLALGPRLLSDPDTYSHIALGRWILDHHSVPTTDPFSANFRGTHWVAFEWLSQIAFAGAHAVGGWLGVAALTAAAVATALGLLTRFLLREWQPNAVLIAVLCAFLLTAPHILTRPHILALPVMVAWIATLIRAVDTRAAPPWRALPLMMLWANRHGNFTFGLAMIAPIARRALACAAFGSTDRFPAVVLIRAPRVRRRMPEPVRTRNDSGDVPHSRPGRSLDDRRRVALAGFYPSRCV